ncbi:MAG: DUF2818 family protein [Burkholderiaceae bacterium]
MSSSFPAWIVLVAALVAANLPFLTTRLMGLVALKDGKSLWIRFAEMLAWYFITGGLGLALEKHEGQIAPQGWEFYAVTGALFVTLAFPGFVWRYLLKHRDPGAAGR